MLLNLFFVNLRWIVRDRVLQALLAIAFLLLVLVPAFSSFSMRQVQELSITLSLSFISFILLVLATLLGASSVWRDIEKRYTASVLPLPQGRGVYLFGKFLAIAFFIVVCASVLGVVAVVAISLGAAQYPSATPIQWPKIFLAIGADCCKYILLAAIALLFSTISTSFFLPFFGTISVYLAGSASQEVFEYVSGEYGKKIASAALFSIKAVYYLIPNFGAFNFKLQAIYPIPLSLAGLGYTAAYFCVYSALILSLAAWFFSRREFP